MWRRRSSVPHELADITHPADRDPEPGVADVGVPVHIVHRQSLPRAPLVGSREVVGGDLRRGVGGVRASPNPAAAMPPDSSAAVMIRVGWRWMFMAITLGIGAERILNVLR